MSTTLQPRRDPASTSGREVTPPDARRSRPPGWRNPRLVLGVLLVATAVVAGARVVAVADDTVPVWAAAEALPAGAEVAPGSLERRDVRFPDAETAAAYLSASEPLAAGTRVDQSVAAGDLLPRSAVATDGAQDLVEVPLSVAVDDLPATVRQGSVVTVYVTPDPAAGTGADGAAREGRAVEVLPEVEVVAVPGAEDGLAPQQTRQVIVGLPADRADELPEALGLLATGRVVVSRIG